MIKTIGERVKETRKKLGLTQSQLAEKVFISESYMALIEAGKRNPSTDVVKCLAEEMGVSIDYLIYGQAEQDIDTVLFNEWKRLTHGRTEFEIKSAYNIVKTFFDTIDKNKN